MHLEFSPRRPTSPSSVLFDEQGADEADEDGVVRADADHVGATPDLAADALQRFVERSLLPRSRGKAMNASSSSSPSSGCVKHILSGSYAEEDA